MRGNITCLDTMTFKIKTTQTKIKTIRQSDLEFTLTDGFITCPRAGFEISGSCPIEYKSIIIQALQYGYLKPVAHVYGKELTMDALRQ
jgi:hypothetical protein